MDNEKRSANILIRAVPSLKERAERIAKIERRSLSAWIEGLIMDGVAAGEAEHPAPPPARKRGRVMADQRQEA